MECKISNGKMVLLKLPSQEVEEKEKECKVKKEEHTEESDEKLIVKQE